MKKSNKPNYTFTIPHEIMQLVDIGKCQNINVDMTDETIIITKTDKTALDILKTIKVLNEMSANLVVQLANACGGCDDCYGCSPFETTEDDFYVDIPPEVFNTFVSAEICLGNLESLCKSGEIISEVADVN